MSLTQLRPEVNAEFAGKSEVVAAHREKLIAAATERRAARLAAAGKAAAVKKHKAELESVRVEVDRRRKIDEEKKKDPVYRYKSFVAQRGTVYTVATQVRDAFKYAATLADSELRAASMTRVAEACELWLKDGFGETAKAKVEELRKTGQEFKAEGADVSDVSDVAAVVNEATELYKANGSKWHHELSRRKNKEKTAKDFEVDRTKLLQWCRQQMSVLANVIEADHVQEFCASFYNNTAVMESNFLVLMEMSEALLPSTEIEEQLMELAEVWLSLETQAFEKLRATLLDLHSKSGLEAQARHWPDFSERFSKFLGESLRVLSIPTDHESVSVAAPLKDKCRELQTNGEPHRLIVAHLSDFALREECLKEHYNTIRKAAFGKLTLMTQSFPGLYAYPRKAEYTDRMAELSDWVEAKSRGQAWKDLLARVDRMKRLIEDNELSLSNTEERY